MKVTVIVPDNAVGKDGLFYPDLDLSGCGIPANVWALQWDGAKGHIEYNTDIDNTEITELPAWVTSALVVWEQAKYVEENPPAPTPEQLAKAYEKDAKELLLKSDWSQLPDINLANKAEWDTYRNALRDIATNPTATPNWPVKPEVIWA